LSPLFAHQHAAARHHDQWLYHKPATAPFRLIESTQRSAHPDHYRRHIALVQQEPVLHQGPLRGSISLRIEGQSASGRSTSRDEKISDACREHLHSPPSRRSLYRMRAHKGLRFSGYWRATHGYCTRTASSNIPAFCCWLDSFREGLTKGKKTCMIACTQRSTIGVPRRLCAATNASAILVFSHGRIRIIQIGKPR